VEESAREVLAEVDGRDWWSVKCGSLSHGMAKRVQLAQALIGDPEVVLLDEPTAGLDPTASAILLALLNDLQADLGLTIVLVEHYVRAVLENCDLVYVLNEGRLIAAGPPAEIAVHPEVRAAYLGTDTDDEEEADVTA
jgi:ABC-type branched-subunit amino acid transport system ATPase component